ncbi:unnamed protein product [Caenorhabditis angaria]|uniref:Uncharacterized protein n=1 Tax=Caenorhabditis angaria TaxID=860376 RepID=A0A9P1MZ38_9PELO|nr:unnamed protein product [Caenorhabditis angaria]
MNSVPKRGRPRGSKKKLEDNLKKLRDERSKDEGFSIMSGWLPDCKCLKNCENLKKITDIRMELNNTEETLEMLINCWSTLIEDKNKELLKRELGKCGDPESFFQKSFEKILETKKKLDAFNVHSIPSRIKNSTKKSELFFEIMLNTPAIFRFSEFLETAKPEWVEDMVETRKLLDDETIFRSVRTGKDTIYIKETRFPILRTFLQHRYNFDVNEYIKSICLDLTKLPQLLLKFASEALLFSRFPDAKDCLVNYWIFAILTYPEDELNMSQFPKIFTDSITLAINELEHEELIEFKEDSFDVIHILKKRMKILDKYGFLINVV